MSERIMRINLWTRYLNIAFAVFWQSDVRFPFDPHPMFWCSLAAIIGNALIHGRALRTHALHAAMYRLFWLDLITVLPAVYFTGGVTSPFICVLPLAISSVYFVRFDLRQTILYGLASFVGFAAAVGLWWLRPLTVEPWRPSEYTAWTLFQLCLQLLVIAASAMQARELPDPLVRERERQEARLAEQQQRAELGTSLAIVAHEIRNPLTTIAISLELTAATARDLPAEAAERLTRHTAAATEEVRRITTMLEGVLSFARERRGVSHPANLDAAAALHRSAEFVRLKWGRHQRRSFALDVVAPERTVLWADADALHQVLVNLLDNAIQNPQPDRPVHIELSAVAHNGTTLLMLRDNGRGIPPDRLTRIFERFETSRPGGTGLGLAIAQQLVIEQGGTIDVTSTEGAGTRFTIALPAAAPGGPGSGDTMGA